MKQVKCHIIIGLLTYAASTALFAQALPAEYRPYLTDETISTLTIGSAPVAGSARSERDRAVFRDTRKFEGTPRWERAVKDGGRGVLAAFSCAADVTLDGNVPALVKLLSKLRTDAISLTKVPADQPVYPAPSVLDKGAVCIAAKEGAKPTNEYPSLQAVWGWTISLLLAEALPERTKPLLQRGYDLGDSAVICGTTTLTAAEQGRVAASALLARLRASPEFVADYAAAKAEIVALLQRQAVEDKLRPEAASCRSEQAVLRQVELLK